MKYVLQACSVLLLCTASAHAQLYKWVGPDGKVTYGDTPPSSATRIESKSPASVVADAAGLPYELALAVKNHPVTLYTAGDCPACDEGRKLLSGRGVPFAEKTVGTSEDAKQLREAGGDGKLPFLAIGRSKQRGFEAGAWNSALTAAGYPETSMLPKTYRNPPAIAAAPAPKPAAVRQKSTEDNGRKPAAASASELPPAVGNAPPGFRF